MSRRTPSARAVLAAIAVLGLALAALTAAQTVVQPASATSPSWLLRPGTNQLEVLDATPGAQLRLLHGSTLLKTGTVDKQGSLEWRLLPAGSYSVQTADRTVTDGPVQVTKLSSPAPKEHFYSRQKLGKGFGFIKTRDGTTLSANVVFPSFGKPPYPTIMEYSGYDPSNPADTSFSQIITALGFAYVGVNIRGTGCSGGSYLPFEPVQSLDGYDAIETIAAQPWVKFHKVGMAGISYPGIEQLYVARTQPPHLAAISPMSVIDDSYRGTLWPGGILNTGFAEPWASARGQQAQPYGEGWEAGMNSQECDNNQLVRLQNPNPVAMIEDHTFLGHNYYNKIDPSTFVHRIDVPTYLAGAWQDEQTGGHFPDFLDKFTGSPAFYATMTNGSHVESLDSMGEFGRWADFLDLYVAHEVPTDVKEFVGPVVSGALTGVTGLSLTRQNDYSGMDYAQALHLYSSQPHFRVLFEEGDAKGSPAGAPVPRFVRRFRSWPVPGVVPTRFYLRNDGALTSRAPSSPSTAKTFSADPTALPATDYTGSSDAIWGAHPAYDWRQIPAGKGLGWITPPMKKTMVVIGGGSLNVWVRTSAPDVDLQATVSEVRPNGKEVYVQTGWLRASHRKIDKAASTPLLPVHTDLRSDARPMPAGKYQRLRIEIPAFAQAFRKGERLRITLNAPGGAKPLWAFRTIDDGQRVTIGADSRHQSSLLLSVVPGVSVPAGAPPCGSLRSQPCRTYP